MNKVLHLARCTDSVFFFFVVVCLLNKNRTWSFTTSSKAFRRRISPKISSHVASLSNPSIAGTSTARDLDEVKYPRVLGRWEEQHGNFLLRPPIERGSPRALIHFLGGAIVGTSPQFSYRYLLERLADQGYLIVATPYSLSFDHLTTCDTIISRFERIAPILARTYGALPVVGIGHSCGALLQLLITSLFPDTPRAANALISFNNKPITDAVPFFEEFFTPFFTFVATRNDTSQYSGSEIISLSLQLAKAAVNGVLPSDDLFNKALQLVSPNGMEKNDLYRNDKKRKNPIKIPSELREIFERLTSPSVVAMTKSGFVPFLTEAIETLEQIPRLINEVAEGARDFIPSPARVKAVAQRTYRARSTFILGYDKDSLDESDEIHELLSVAGQVIRMKRPMIQIDLQRRTLSGGHASPLLAPPLDVVLQAETLLGAETAKERLSYENAYKTVEELIRWLEQSNL